ncbi:Kunitz/Bovine pancreatic trypsin inhibitor domain protein [Oesophagostomum dentatum]|uniref:Kunitz/Bovine pancreatic trypsin inhibitor domain protein n=1 Tax=Oesophagostomum dentatum TaxID=61180 RepID=A0A0B1T2P5_OESDE|nr:Kunitz/Bovine pancreatic trypsin inhibitor domain protein [Oesophagostomum dentatum]
MKLLVNVAFFGLALNNGICELKIDAGSCDRFVPRYGYSTEQKKCIPFTYGGCFGNDNNFFSLEDCQELCVQGLLI